MCEVASLSATKCSGISQADDDDKDDELMIEVMRMMKDDLTVKYKSH